MLESICQKIERSEKLDHPEHVNQLLEFFSVFVDKCHHGKEEEILFPTLEQRGIRRDAGPIGVMLNEHERGREHIRKMREGFAQYRSGKTEAAADFIRNARGYIALLDQHISKENNVLFPLAEEKLSEAEQTELSNGSETIEITKIGAGKHEEFHKMLANLKESYLE